MNWNGIEELAAVLYKIKLTAAQICGSANENEKT